jgi:alcohol dehydrogenase
MDPLRVYQHSNPGRLIFGPGALAELKKEINAKERPLLITDEGVARAGILKRVTDLLVEAGIRYELFDRVQADPPIEVIEEAAALYKERSCTSIIGLGGGSSIDVAKAVAVMGTGEGTLKEYLAGKPVEGTLPLLYAIPTTAGTGSEVTAVAIISDNESKVKMTLKNSMLVPRVAVLDPLLLVSIPSKVAAETGADALTHAIESYLAPGSQVITEALALSAVRMIMNNLPTFVANSRDVAAAGQMLLASCMASLAFANTGLGLTHSLAHPVGAYCHITHGLACALYLPAVMEFNVPACAEKLASIAGAAGTDVCGLSPEKAAAEAVRKVRDLFAKVSLPRTFSETGIDFKLQPKMVDDAFEMVPTKNNPRPADKDQIAALFASAQ